MLSLLFFDHKISVLFRMKTALCANNSARDQTYVLEGWGKSQKPKYCICIFWTCFLKNDIAKLRKHHEPWRIFDREREVSGFWAKRNQAEM